MMRKVLLLAFLTVCVKETIGHGMMLEPPNRSSLWRFDHTSPINYNDNQNFCGGFDVQYKKNGGKCGVCGDNYADRHPQANENTGKYGRGKVVRTYKMGSTIDIKILITANHYGTFSYSICKLDNPKAPEKGESCFKPLLLDNGAKVYNVAYSKGSKEFKMRVKLPKNLKCNRCVLRWHYRAGNNWGTCPDGSQRKGCGPQETFRSCADVRIV